MYVIHERSILLYSCYINGLSNNDNNNNSNNSDNNDNNDNNDSLQKRAVISSLLLVARNILSGGMSAPHAHQQQQQFQTTDVNQCLHSKSSSHGVPNVNLFDFIFLLVDYGKVLCSLANNLQQNSNAPAIKKEYSPQKSLD